MLKPAVERHLARQAGEPGEFCEAAWCIAGADYTNSRHGSSLSASQKPWLCVSVDMQVIILLLLHKEVKPN